MVDWNVLSRSGEVVATCYTGSYKHTEAEQHGNHFADNSFKSIFLNEMHEFRLKVPWSLFLRVQFKIIRRWFRKWRRGDKPLSEPAMVRLPTNICVKWPQWVNLGFYFVYVSIHRIHYDWNEVPLYLRNNFQYSDRTNSIHDMNAFYEYNGDEKFPKYLRAVHLVTDWIKFAWNLIIRTSTGTTKAHTW